MRSFVFYARFEPGEKKGIVVSFPDVPEAITQGDNLADARHMAEEALGLALLTYPERCYPLPRRRARGKGLAAVGVAPQTAAKLAVLDVFRQAGIAKSDLARRMGKDEKKIRRILDPRHATKLPALTAALEAMGQRLIVGVEKAA
jgi:antitoxin HicB